MNTSPHTSMPAANSNRKRRPGSLTLLLSDVTNPASLSMVMELAYAELRATARGHWIKEQQNQSWQPTELLHEACIRLIQHPALYQNRKHFFATASKVMRRVLVDRARRRKTNKRGGDWQRTDFSHAERIGFDHPDDLANFDRMLTKLNRVQPALAEIVELRVFSGCSIREAAAVLDIGGSTARRRWTLAKRWLQDALANPTTTPRQSREPKN